MGASVCCRATTPNNQPTFFCVRTAIISWNKCNTDRKLKTNVCLILSCMNESFAQGLIISIDCFALPKYHSLHHRCPSVKSSTWPLNLLTTRGWISKWIGGFWKFPISSKILMDFQILQFQEIADASIFWAQIFDFRFNKIFLPKFQIHDDILAVNLVHNS